MKIFLICPVRNANEKQIKLINNYIIKQENLGNTVFYPARDNLLEHSDTCGYDICSVNCNAIKNCDEVHIFWDENSQGSLFDLGSAFALNKKLVIVNQDQIKKTDCKSFSNMINLWSKK